MRHSPLNVVELSDTGHNVAADSIPHIVVHSVTLYCATGGEIMDRYFITAHKSRTRPDNTKD